MLTKLFIFFLEKNSATSQLTVPRHGVLMSDFNEPISAMIAGNRAITTIIYDSIDHLRSLLRNELVP